jgi:uncharacterized metal-binding protein YceD (DUF177 family)
MTQVSEKAIWSIPVLVDDVPETGRHFDVQADAATRAALAPVLGLRSLERFGFSFDVTRRGRDSLNVRGQVNAIVGLTCVVTLDPIESDVTEEVDVDFLPPGAADLETFANGTDRESPEPLVDNAADLGALATEFLILSVEPYPRKAGVAFVNPECDTGDPGPFAALAKLKQRPDR